MKEGDGRTKVGEPASAATAAGNAAVACPDDDKEQKMSKLVERRATVAVDRFQARLHEKLLTGSNTQSIASSAQKQRTMKEGDAAAAVNAEVACANNDKERKSKLMGRKATVAVDRFQARLNDLLIRHSTQTRILTLTWRVKMLRWHHSRLHWI
jgi:hypothetical protein